MNYSGFTTKLKLAYSPVSNYDFTFLKSEPIVMQILEGSMLYIIAQRPILTFENVDKSEDGKSLVFDIAQEGINIRVNCSIPLSQPLILAMEKDEVEVVLFSHDKDWNQTTLPATRVTGMQFFDQDGNFLLWLSPDKFLHHFSNRILEAGVNGDYRQLMKYNVHYVGKATEQKIWKRLTGHSTLQDILSIENPFDYGSLPTHEIVLLLFRSEDSFSFRVLDPKGNVDDFVDGLMGGKHPTEKDISLDAEKLLIKLLDPKYNKVKFPNYPVSKDGLHSFGYERLAYQIQEDITLVYKDGEIICNIDNKKCDILGVVGRNSVEIIRPTQ